jgi:hypothetical protein
MLCFGLYGGVGRCGLGASIRAHPIPAVTPIPGEVKSIATGTRHSIVISKEEIAYSFGYC